MEKVLKEKKERKKRCEGRGYKRYDPPLNSSDFSNNRYKL
jgi:hypothetical protein